MVDLPAALLAHARFGVDTPIFIYHIEESAPYSVAAEHVLRLMSQCPASGVTSVLTLTELLVAPLAAGRRGLAGRYEALVRSIPNLTVVDVDASIARQAAQLRAAYRLRTADAVQIASALEHGATAFVTNDRRLRRVDEIEVLLLDDFVKR